MKVIAIDPDVDESGVCVAISGQLLHLSTMPLWELFDFIKYNSNSKIIIEAGWLVKTKSWHGGGKGSSYDVGRNSEIGRQIEKLCKKHNINYQLVKPQGYSDKVKYTPAMFKAITGWELPKAKKEKTQDMIVAGIFAFIHSTIKTLKK